MVLSPILFCWIAALQDPRRSSLWGMMDRLEPSVTWGQETIQLLVREREREPLFRGALLVLFAGMQAVGVIRVRTQQSAWTWKACQWCSVVESQPLYRERPRSLRNPVFSLTVEQKPGKPAESGIFAEIKCGLSCRDITTWRLGLLLEVSPSRNHLWFGI